MGHRISSPILQSYYFFVKTERNNAPFFVKTERNDLHNRYQTYILNKSSIVTTLCTLPEYSLCDNEYVVTRVMVLKTRKDGTHSSRICINKNKLRPECNGK